MRVNRREFIRSSTAGAIAATLASSLLNACAPAPPAGSGSAGAANVGAGPGSSKIAGMLPTYIPFSGGPKPDYHSSDARVVDAFEHFPRNPFKSWTKERPGTGSTVNVLIAAYYPPPTPYEQNLTWQDVNKQLNADVRMNIIPASDWRTKFATTMASGDLPDIMHIYFGLTWTPNTAPFIESAAADLTPYLAGDAIKDYPNLAAIPTYAWQNSVSAFDGKLYQWPIHRYLPGLAYFFKNTGIYNQEIGPEYVPKDADDFKKVLQQLNRPQEGRWAIGNTGTSPLNFGIRGYAELFGAPNTWGNDAGGKLVHYFETEQFKAAVGYVRDLWSAGLIWQDAPTGAPSRAHFAAGNFALSVEGFGNSWNDFWRQGLGKNPPNTFDIIRPFSATAGAKPVSYLSGGWVSTTVLKKASPERIKELLRIVDWLAAPFGSQEDLLLSYGVEGRDYVVDANGDPSLTSIGNTDAGYVPWRYISQHPYATYQADLPGYSRRTFEVEQMLVAEGLQDVTAGLYSKTNYAASATTATQTFSDGVNDIIMSRRPLSDYAQLVSGWQDAAGNQIRREYTDAIAAAR